jgi:hypothetical protein
MIPELRRQALLDRLAAGQYNGITRPSPEDKRLARAAFDELYADDEGFRKVIDENRESRRQRRWFRRWWRRAASLGRPA